MERKKVDAYAGAAYPEILEVMDRRAVIRGIGLAGGALAASTAVGCPVHLMGVIADPDGETVQVSLPPEPDVRTLYLEWQGTIDYHVVAVVAGFDLAQYLHDECPNLLDAIDGVLATHPIHDFEPGSDTTTIAAEITQTLADAWAGTLGAPTDAFHLVEFVVDYYNEEEEIDGDIADPE